jgi:4'-phosphopantetheinyl transferase
MRALHAGAEAGAGELCAELCVALSRLCLRAEDYDSWSTANEQAMSALKSSGSSERVGLILHSAGVCASSQARYGDAEEKLEQAITTFRRAGLAEQASVVSLDLAAVSLKRGEPGRALERLADATANSREFDRLRAALLKSQALLDLGSVSEAEESAGLATYLCGRVGSESLRRRLDAVSGRILQSRQREPESIKVFERLLRESEGARDTEGELSALHGLALVDAAQRVQRWRELQRVSSFRGHAWYSATASLGLSFAVAEEGELDEARELASRAVAEFAAVDSLKGRIRALLAMGDFYAASGNEAAARFAWKAGCADLDADRPVDSVALDEFRSRLALERIKTTIPDTTVWMVNTETGNSSYSNLLGEAELRRADAFVRPQDRRDYEASHAALRLVLAKAVGGDPRELRFGRASCPLCGGPHGKPVLMGPGMPSFSLSHTEGAALIAVSTREVGADIERIGRAESLESMVHPREAEELRLAAAEDRPVAATRLWTRKEAYLKGLGTGVVGDGLSGDYIGTAPGPVRAPGDWVIIDVTVPAGLCAAVAVRKARIRSASEVR